MRSSMVRVNVNVSGVRYEFDKSILKGKENETLAKLCDDSKNSSPLELIVDRPVECFAAVLNYYQTGELHMPQQVCPKSFKTELEFWNISPTVLQLCCDYRYYTFFDEFDTRERFRAESANDVGSGAAEHIHVRTENKITRLRRTIWNIIDFQEKTLRSKIYQVVLFFMVLLCIMTLGLSTVKSFHRNVKRCEMLEYMEYSGHEDFQTTLDQFGSPDCTANYYTDDDYLEYYYFQYNDTYYGIQQVQLPPITIRLFVFDVLEYIAAGFFTIDLIIRIGTCPSIPQFVRSIVNIFDTLAVLAFFTQIIIIHAFLKEHKYMVSWIKAIGYLQLFRVMRLFRLMKNVRSSRVLTFSLKSSAKDMILVLLLLLIVVSFFGSLIYFIENGQTITSIPEAWYWTMITITTVGYGDISPETAAGRFVAAILAICGVLLLSITLPIFVNNFLALYQYSCIDELLEKAAMKQQVMINSNEKKTNNNTPELESVDNIPVIVQPEL